MIGGPGEREDGEGKWKGPRENQLVRAVWPAGDFDR